jgi:hypothetical protein
MMKFSNCTVVRILSHYLFSIDFKSIEIIEHFGFATFWEGIEVVRWRLIRGDLVVDREIVIDKVRNVDVFACDDAVLVLDGGFLNAFGKLLDLF